MKIKNLMIISLITCFVFSAIGCQQKDVDVDKDDIQNESIINNQKDEDKNDTEEQEDEKNVIENDSDEEAKIELPDVELKNKQLTYFFWTDVDEERSKQENVLRPVDIFEQKYGGEISTIVGTHGEYWEKLAALTASGDAPDFIYMPDWNWFPQSITKNIVECAEDYIDFSKPLWKDVEKANEEYEWKGKIYTPVIYEYVWEWLYYNKDIFENYGVDTPKDYYERDEWTWDKLKDVAVELTDDTDGDGEIDQWGFCSIYCPFVYVCGEQVVESTEDGYFKHNLKSPKIANALSLFHELGESSLNVFGGYTGAMKNGKLAMYCFVPWGHSEDFRDAWDRGEIEIAPIPKPTKDSEYVLPVKAQCHGIGNGCKNPEGAALLIELYRYENTQEYRDKYKDATLYITGCKVDKDANLLSSPLLTDDQIQYHKELMELPKVSTAWETWYQERDLSINRVLKGEPWSKVVEEIYPQKQKVLEDYFKN